jgi:hypothetical protein
VRIVRTAGSVSVMTALALLQTSPALADGPPIPPPVTHTVTRHPEHLHLHHVPRLPAVPPTRTTLTVVKPVAEPVVKPVLKPVVHRPVLVPTAVIVAEPPAAFPGATVLLRVGPGCTAPTTAASDAFAAPAPLPGSAQINSAAGAGIHAVTARCADGVRASGVLRVLSPAQLGAVHAGGGWGADRLTMALATTTASSTGTDDRPDRAARPGWADRPIDTAIAAGFALAGFLLTILVRQRNRAGGIGRTDA